MRDVNDINTFRAANQAWDSFAAEFPRAAASNMAFEIFRNGFARGVSWGLDVTGVSADHELAELDALSASDRNAAYDRAKARGGCFDDAYADELRKLCEKLACALGLDDGHVEP